LIEKVKFAFEWIFTKKGKRNFETAADKYAIEKGYARGLYSRVFSGEKDGPKEKIIRRNKVGYLTSEQIKLYAKKIRKW